MSTTKNKGIAMAVGIFIVLSLVVFGSILYVGFTSVNTEIVVVDTMEDVFTDDEGIRLGDYLMSQDLWYSGHRTDKEADECCRRGDIEYVPTFSPREPPVIRDPRPGDPADPDRPSLPVVGVDYCPRCPPVIRDPRPVDRMDPIYKPIVVDPYDPVGVFQD